MSHLLLILPMIWLAVISPGADFAMISRVSCFDGRRAGVTAALGIALGCWFHITYAILGLGVLARLFPQFLTALKFAGALYLIWLGFSMAVANAVPAATNASPSVQDRRRPLMTGVLTNGLNPKASIFVVSLYSQVIGPATPLPTKLGYGAIISLSHFIWFGTVSIFLSQPSIREWVLARQRLVNRIIGTVLVLLGVALGLADLHI